MIFFSFLSPLLRSSSTHRRLYPQRFSGLAVVTVVVPSLPRYVPSFLSRVGFSIPTARRFLSNVANSRSRASSPYEYVHSVRIELAKLILVGTRITLSIPSHRGRRLKLYKPECRSYMNYCCTAFSIMH